MSAEAGPSRLARNQEWKGFSDVVFFVNDSLSGKDQANIKQVLLSSGGTPCPAPEPNALQETSLANSQEKRRRQPRFDVEKVTHVISDTYDFPEMEELKERMVEGKVWICSPQWAPRSMLTRQLQEPKYFSIDPAMIFSGICIACLADIPAGDREIVIGAVTALGGQSRIAAVADVTHFVTLGPDPDVFATVAGAKTGMKFVLPHWIYECIKIQRLLPTLLYEFTQAGVNPPILDAALGEDATNATEALMAKHHKNMSAAPIGSVASKENDAIHRTAVDQQVDHVETEYSVEKRVGTGESMSTVFRGKKVLLGKELEVDDAARIALNSWIRLAKGEPLNVGTEISECDILITRWRDGADYVEGIKQGKILATLSWFYHVITINRLTSPKGHLLHYPVPRVGIDGSDKLVMSVTNYSGSSREYLKKLILAIGGEFTTTLSPVNTHLLAANLEGVKVKRAAHWNTPIVNHFWLEDCFKAWSVVTITPRHIEYPKGVHYATLVGDVGLTDADIERWVTATSTAVVTDDTDCQEDLELGDVDNDLRVGSMDTPADGPRLIVEAVRNTSQLCNGSSTGNAEAGPSRTKSRQEGTRKSRLVEEDAPEVTLMRKKARHSSPGSERSHGPAPGLELDNVLAEGSSRKSKRAAEERVHVMSMDALAYQKTKGRKCLIDPKDRQDCLVSSMKRDTPPERDASEARGTRKASVRDDSPVILDEKPNKGRKRRSDGDAEEPVAKQKQTAPAQVKAVPGARSRGRSASVPVKAESECYYMTTGVILTDREISDLRKLGAKQVEAPELCTHLICAGLARTPKFLQCIPYAPSIVTQGWVTDSIKQKHLADAEPYLVEDPAAEKKHDFSLVTSLMRARVCIENGALLQGHTFHITAAVPMSMDALFSIIAAAGGKACKHGSKSNKLLSDPSTRPLNHLISCPADEKLWSKLVVERGVTVYDRELILKGVLRMQMDWEGEEGHGAVVVAEKGVGKWADEEEQADEEDE